MRRLLFILLLFPIVGLAQYDFSAGFEAGLVSSHIQGDSYAGFNKIGPAGGVFVKVGFSDKIAGRMQIHYAAKGSRNKPNTQAGNFDQRGFNLNYVEIPVSVMWNLGDAISLDAGLYYAVLLSQRDLRGGTFGEIDDYDEGDFGSQIGVTWGFSDKYYLLAKYSFSVLPINGNLVENTGNGVIAGAYNHCASLMIGMQLGSGN